MINITGTEYTVLQFLCAALLWTAPELMEKQRASATGLSVVTYGTQKGDVYSFAVILHEILYRSGIFRCFEDEERIPAKSESVNRTRTITLYLPVFIGDAVAKRGDGNCLSVRHGRVDMVNVWN